MIETFGLLTSTSTTPTAHKYSPFQFKMLSAVVVCVWRDGVGTAQLLQSCPKVVKRQTLNMHVACTEHAEETCMHNATFINVLRAQQ